MTHWSDDASLWDAMTPALSAPVRYVVADAEVATIVEKVELRPGARVLDLACGAGVHAVAFAARGFRVTAVDRSAGLLRLAETRASAMGVSVELVHADMRKFIRPFGYDVACSLKSSFAYFEDEVNLRVLRNMKESLRTGATLVLDTLGEGVVSCTADAGIHEIAGTRYSVRRSFDNVRSVVQEEWTVDRAGDAQHYRTEQRIYTAAELVSMLETVGLTKVTIAASLDATAHYDQYSPRLVAFAGAA